MNYKHERKSNLKKKETCLFAAGVNRRKSALCASCVFVLY